MNENLGSDGRVKGQGEQMWRLFFFLPKSFKERRVKRRPGLLCVERWLIPQFRFDCCEGQTISFVFETAESSSSGRSDLRHRKAEVGGGRRRILKKLKINEFCDTPRTSERKLKKKKKIKVGPNQCKW